MGNLPIQLNELGRWRRYSCLSSGVAQSAAQRVETDAADVERALVEVLDVELLRAGGIQ
jgi:hypothetical protein